MNQASPLSFVRCSTVERGASPANDVRRSTQKHPQRAVTTSSIQPTRDSQTSLVVACRSPFVAGHWYFRQCSSGEWLIEVAASVRQSIFSCCTESNQTHGGMGRIDAWPSAASRNV